MIVNRNSTLFYITGVLTLIVVFAVQIVPHSECHFDVEISKTLDLEDTDSEEKDAEEEFEKKYSQNFDESLKSAFNKKSADFYFLHCISAAPTLETVSPPPDWI